MLLPMAVLGLLLAGLAPLMPAVAASPSAESPKAERKAKSPDRVAALTGCVDEREGRYVLTGDRELKVIADLEADGFPTEGFAKYLGKKVTVRGRQIAGDGRPLVRVRSVAIVSDTCTRSQPSQ
jgi:hypothetical protein